MSSCVFKYTTEDGPSLHIRKYEEDPVAVWIDTRGTTGNEVYIPNADVPTVAAELLKAAGHHYLAGYIEGGIDVQERAEKAEAEAAEKKLQERRNALAKKYHGLDFVHIGEGGQRVINDIIELQDKLDGASRD